MRISIRLTLIAVLGLWICSCDLSETHISDTLTFRLDDTLKTSAGKYDSIRLDLFTISGRDTAFARTIFHGEYLDSAQLRNLSLGGNLNGEFLIRVIAYKYREPVLEIGVPFSDGKRAGTTIVYRAPERDSSIHRSPYLLPGPTEYSLEKGGALRIILKARDPDADPIRFQILNLDSLHALFPGNAIGVVTGGDSLVLDFSPGAIEGNFRFRVALVDPFLPPVVQILTISVGRVNRPPSVSIQGAASGTHFKIKEGTAFALHLVAQDPDSGDHVAISGLVNPPWPDCGRGEFDSTTGRLEFKPSFQCIASGETTFADWVFRAVDDGKPSEAGQLSVRITILDSNSAPRWKSLSLSAPGKESVPMEVDLSGNFIGDAESDSVEFSTTCGFVDAETIHWSFTPGYRDAGSMDCEIQAVDSHIPPASSKMILKLAIADSIRPVDVAIVSPARLTSTRDSLVIVKWKVGDQWQTQDTLEVLHNEGANIIRRTYRDSLGRVGSDSTIVFRDTEPPPAPVVSSVSPSLTNNPRPTWVWKSGGRGGSGNYRFKMGDTAWDFGGLMSAAESFTPSSNLFEGRHTLYVQERDSAGNWSNSGNCEIITDYTAPNPPLITSTGFHTLNPKPTWKWKSGGNGGAGIFRYELDKDPEEVSAIEESYTPALSLPVGTEHTLTVQERDSAGNWSEPASYPIRIHGRIGYTACGAGGVLKTSNQGESWDTLPRLVKTDLKSLWFNDAYHGTLVGREGVILKTSDGGQIWRKVSGSTMENFNSIFHLNRDIAYLGSEDGRILRSDDQGETWSPLNELGGTSFTCIRFYGGRYGIAVGVSIQGTRGSISVTSDSGKTWEVKVADAAYGLLSAYPIDANTIVCVGMNGSIVRTTDGGKTWKEMNSGTSVELGSVCFLDHRTGFVSGEGGTILKTVDGGMSWAPVALNYPHRIGSLIFLDEKTGFASGGAGELLRTSDGGTTWQKVSFPPWVEYPLPQYPEIAQYTLPVCSQIFFP